MVIGILSAFIIVGMAGVSDKARIAKGQVFVNSLRNSLLSNLISEWSFEGPTTAGSAATNDDAKDMWAGYNGQVSGTAITVKGGGDCVSGKCLDFNPVDSGTLSMITNIITGVTGKNLTVSYWVYRRDGVRYNGGVFTVGEGAGLVQIQNQGSAIILYNTLRDISMWVNFYYEDSSSVNNTFSFPKNIDNSWHLIAISYNGSAVRAFLDGQELIPVSKTGDLRLATSWKINLANITTYYLNGRLDNVKLFNYGITSGQAREMYFSGLNKLLTNNGINQEEFMERISQLDSSVGEN